MAKIILLDRVREKKIAQESHPDYLEQLEGMDKLGLLEEMIQFQEERANSGGLTLSLMIRGEILFRLLEEKAETNELRELARVYRRHLKLELENFMKKRDRSTAESVTKNRSN